MGCPQDQLSDVVAFSFGKSLKRAATHDVIVRLWLTRKAVSTIDSRYDENAVPPFFFSPTSLCLPLAFALCWCVAMLATFSLSLGLSVSRNGESSLLEGLRV